MRSKKDFIESERLEPPKSYTYVTENVLVDGVPVQKLVKKEVIPDNELVDSDFSLTTIIATGAIGLLKPTNPISPSNIAMLDNAQNVLASIDNVEPNND